MKEPVKIFIASILSAASSHKLLAFDDLLAQYSETEKNTILSTPGLKETVKVAKLILDKNFSVEQDFESAKFEAEALIPINTVAYILLGNLYFKRQEYQTAAEYYCSAIENGKTSAWRHLGELLYTNGITLSNLEQHHDIYTKLNGKDTIEQYVYCLGQAMRSSNSARAWDCFARLLDPSVSITDSTLENNFPEEIWFLLKDKKSQKDKVFFCFGYAAMLDSAMGWGELGVIIRSKQIENAKLTISNHTLPEPICAQLKGKKPLDQALYCFGKAAELKYELIWTRIGLILKNSSESDLSSCIFPENIQKELKNKLTKKEKLIYCFEKGAKAGDILGWENLITVVLDEKIKNVADFLKFITASKNSSYRELIKIALDKSLEIAKDTKAASFIKGQSQNSQMTQKLSSFYKAMKYTPEGERSKILAVVLATEAKLTNTEAVSQSETKAGATKTGIREVGIFGTSSGKKATIDAPGLREGLLDTTIRYDS